MRYPAAFLLSALALLSACAKDPPKTDAGSDPDAEVPGTAADSKGGVATEANTGQDPASSKTPALGDGDDLVRAELPLDARLKGMRSLNPEMRSIKGLYALAAEAEVAGWGQDGDGTPDLLRDDDMNTTWTCERSEERSCAVGLSFPEPARVRAIRLFAAAGPHWRTFVGHPRPRKVRLHTDAGHADVELPDGGAHRYLMLSEEIETSSIAVEVLTMYTGKKSDLLHVGEIEAYGTSGEARAPLDLDPATMTVSFETERWKHKQSDTGGFFVTRPSYVEMQRSDGSASRFARGSAIFGKKGDRLLLSQHMRQTDCTEHQGSFVLIDQKTRMFLNLGALGGLDQPVYRHLQGLGFAVGDVRVEPFSLKGAVLEEGELVRKRPPRTPLATSATEQLTEWGMESRPTPRDGSVSVDAPDPLCKRPTKAQLTKALRKAKPTDAQALEGAKDVDAWMLCSAQEGRSMLVHETKDCAGWHAALALDDKGVVTDQRWSKQADARGPRVATLADGHLAVELDRLQGNESALFGINAEGKFDRIRGGAGFALRMPGNCVCSADAP